ncbi:hypothetical protein PAXRUDRAFT_836405 [Paxillus rubicundulus Ve08.2h10]|uniref:Uncharacterized protein n=1 Tax=Paxillus rubicundulus Ve08.2h10 TaxID=930991 RepID=A0A0D0CYT5_9AGAM|nr:hypothetical protein PAXRUDRAFT_836405 [Paxillus rubicundulus Ve08.2h10]
MVTIPDVNYFGRNVRPRTEIMGLVERLELCTIPCTSIVTLSVKLVQEVYSLNNSASEDTYGVRQPAAQRVRGM